MCRRFTALLLAMAFVLSLTGCGKQKSQSAGTVEKKYASDQSVDVFEAIEAVRGMKDLTFDLSVSTVDAQTGEAVRTKYTASGAWYTSTKQASMTAALEDQSTLTSVVVDGDRLYVDTATAAKTLAEHFKALSGEENQYYYEELTDAAAGFSTDYVSFSLKEDPWTALETGALSESKASLKTLYERVKKDNARRVSMSESSGILSLGLGDLQGTLIDITGDLLKNKTTYQAGVTDVLTLDFGAVLDESGWDAEALLEEKWAEYQETYETLVELQSAGDFNGWSAKLVTCGDAEAGYTLDLTLNFDDPVNYCLSVYPAQPEPVTVPAESMDNKEAAEGVLAVYRDAKTYFKNAFSSEEEEGEELTEEELKENFGDMEEFYSDVDTAPVEEYPSLLSTAMVTDDAVAVTVPLLASYDTLEGESIADGVNDVFENANGYVLEYVSTEKRDVKTVADENARLYVSEFRDSWGYEITQDSSQVSVSRDGTTAVAGMGYYDADAGQDVTVITGCIDVQESEFMLAFDLFVYSKSVTRKEVSAMEDLLTYLGVETPVTITRN